MLRRALPLGKAAIMAKYLRRRSDKNADSTASASAPPASAGTFPSPATTFAPVPGKEDSKPSQSSSPDSSSPPSGSSHQAAATMAAAASAHQAAATMAAAADYHFWLIDVVHGMRYHTEWRILFIKRDVQNVLCSVHGRATMRPVYVMWTIYFRQPGTTTY